MKTILMQKKSMIAAGIMAIVILLGAGVYLYLKTPVNLLAIDVNPSIELQTNRLNQVVAINPVNEDAADLMAGYQPKNRDLDSVIEDIVDRLIFFGYLTADQKNQILITADDTYNSSDLLNTVNSTIADYMAERQLEVEVFKQQLAVDSTEQDAAHANNVSFGKMSLINELTAKGINLTTEELTGSSIRELIGYAVAQGISLEDLIDNYNDLIADQVKAATAGITDAEAVKDDSDEELKDATDALVEDASDENDASIEDAQDENDAEDADKDSTEDADDDQDSNKASHVDADQAKHIKANDSEDEDTYEASNEDGDSQGEDQDYEDASDENEQGEDAFEEADDNKDGSRHEDSYYEDSEDGDTSDIEENDNSYYQEDQDNDNQGDEDNNGSWENDNHQGDENEDN